MEFIVAARIEDEIVRRDSLHAVINSLPDPNYATLRVLILVSLGRILITRCTANTSPAHVPRHRAFSGEQDECK